MILYYIVDFILTIGEMFIKNIDPFYFGEDLGHIIDFIANIFTYANVLFPLKELTPIAHIYFSWFYIRFNLAVLGFVKKYIPIA